MPAIIAQRSVSKQEKICGDFEGVRSPCYVINRFGRECRRSGEEANILMNPEKTSSKKHEDFGNGWKTVHHYEEEFLSFGQPRHYHFHLSASPKPCNI